MSSTPKSPNRRATVFQRFSESDQKRHMELFEHFDKDGNGVIDRGELESILRDVDSDESRSNIRRAIQAVARRGSHDGGGSRDAADTPDVTFEGFLYVLELLEKRKSELQRGRDVFRRLLNKKGTGVVDAEQLRSSLQALNLGLEPTFVDLMHGAVCTEAAAGGPPRKVFTQDDFTAFCTRVYNSEGSDAEFAAAASHVRRGSSVFGQFTFGEDDGKGGTGGATPAAAAASSPMSAPDTTDHDASGLNEEAAVLKAWLRVLQGSSRHLEVHSVEARCQPSARSVRRPTIQERQAPATEQTVDLRDLQSALDSCPPNTTLLVGEGLLETPIVLARDSIMLVGAGMGNTRIEVDGKSPGLLIRAAKGGVRGFTVLNNGQGPAIQIEHSSIELTECEAASKGGGGCLVRAKAHPLVRDCVFRDCKRWGLMVTDAKAMVEGCECSGNHDGGVVVEESAFVQVSKCTITDGKGCGVVFDNASGAVMDSTLSRNTCAGVFASNGATPVVWKNVIRDGEAAGVTVESNSHAHIEENELGSNETSDVEVSSRATTHIINNTFTGGPTSAIHVVGKGAVVAEGNRIEGYAFTGVSISGSGTSFQIQENTIVRNVGRHGGASALCLKDPSATGKIVDNALVGWSTQHDSLASMGVPLSVGQSTRGTSLEIHGNIAGMTEVACHADRIFYALGKHTGRRG